MKISRDDSKRSRTLIGNRGWWSKFLHSIFKKYQYVVTECVCNSKAYFSIAIKILSMMIDCGSEPAVNGSSPSPKKSQQSNQINLIPQYPCFHVIKIRNCNEYRLFPLENGINKIRWWHNYPSYWTHLPIVLAKQLYFGRTSSKVTSC